MKIKLYLVTLFSVASVFLGMTAYADHHSSRIRYYCKCDVPGDGTFGLYWCSFDPETGRETNIRMLNWGNTYPDRAAEACQSYYDAAPECR